MRDLIKSGACFIIQLISKYYSMLVNNNNVQCFFRLYTKRKGQTNINNLVLKDSLKKSAVLKVIRKKYKNYLNFI